MILWIQMTNLKVAFKFRFVLFLFLALFGSSSRAEAQQLKKVHAAIPAITPAAAPFAIAKDRGFYREEGLDVDLIVMPSAVGIQALIGGNVNFSTQGGAGLLPHFGERRSGFYLALTAVRCTGFMLGRR